MLIAFPSPNCLIFKIEVLGHLVTQQVKCPNFGSGHDLMAYEFETCVGLCADSSELEACFPFCVSLSLPIPQLMLCLSLSVSVSQK